MFQNIQIVLRNRIMKHLRIHRWRYNLLAVARKHGSREHIICQTMCHLCNHIRCRWGYENNIVKGLKADKFGPDSDVTREQMVTMLWRYAKYKNMDAKTENKLSRFWIVLSCAVAAG